MSDTRQWPDLHGHDSAQAAPLTSEEDGWPGGCTEFVYPERPAVPSQQPDGKSDSDDEDFSARWWPNLSTDWP